MSALCQKRTYAVQQTVSLFDYVVSELSELQRHIQAERLGGLEVDYQLELGGRLNRQIAWFCALEDAIDIQHGAPVLIGNIWAVRDQAADFRERTRPIDG